MSQSLNIYMSMVLILIFKISMVRFIYYNRITLANIISIDTGRLMSLRGKGNLPISNPYLSVALKEGYEQDLKLDIYHVTFYH